MKPYTTIAIIGGTGKSGSFLVKELLQQGYACRLLLRKPENFSYSHPLITPVKGDAGNQADIMELLKGADAVMSTLGQPKGEAPIFSRATAYILRAMQEHHIKRYILVTGLSIDVPGDKKTEPTAAKSAFMRSAFPDIIADKQKEYALLETSGVSYTLARLPLIEPAESKETLHTSLLDCQGDKIYAGSLAVFLIKQLDDPTYEKKAPFVWNG